MEIVTLDRVPLESAAGALAEAFGSGRDRAEWVGLLEREVGSGRVDAGRSPVAVDRRRVVGACVVNVGDGPVARVGPTGVAPPAQRRGIGRDLVRSALGRLRGAGARRVVLEVATDNLAAQALYRSLGFEPWRGLRVLVGRRSDLAPSGVVAAERASRDGALAFLAAAGAPPRAFQRRPAYVGSFHDGVVGYQVRDGAHVVGALLQRGRDVLDLAALPPDREVLAALVWAAGETAWVQRILHVPDGDPCGDHLEAIGFTVESRAIEMVRVDP